MNLLRKIWYKFYTKYLMYKYSHIGFDYKKDDDTIIRYSGKLIEKNNDYVVMENIVDVNGEIKKVKTILYHDL